MFAGLKLVLEQFQTTKNPLIIMLAKNVACFCARRNRNTLSSSGLNCIFEEKCQLISVLNSGDLVKEFIFRLLTTFQRCYKNYEASELTWYKRCHNIILFINFS